MGDRTQRIEGKVNGTAARESSAAYGDRKVQARGPGEDLAGNAKQAAGKVKGEFKKATR